MRADTESHGSMPSPEQVDLAVEVFRMPPVYEPAEAVGKAPAGISQHLTKLRMARLVRTRRQANQIFDQ